jgi:hypothetical protein
MLVLAASLVPTLTLLPAPPVEPTTPVLPTAPAAEAQARTLDPTLDRAGQVTTAARWIGWRDAI